MGAAARAGVGAAAAACGCYPAPARARARTHARPGTRAAGARRSVRRGARRRATCAGAGATRGGSASWDDAFPDPTASPAGDAGAGVAATADPPSASLRSFAREAANRGELAGELLFRARAPQPVAFPRRSVRLRLAVLLLRSTYESVSSAEVVSDADFQRFFFLERQSAWQPYLNLYSPTRIDQGDLSDPLYFDYISAAQYLTLARILRDASSGALPLLYERTVYVPPDEEAGTEERWETSVARRNPDLDDAGALQAFIERAVGDTILGHAETDFADAKVTVPPACEDPRCAGARALICVWRDACGHRPRVWGGGRRWRRRSPPRRRGHRSACEWSLMSARGRLRACVPHHHGHLARPPACSRP